MNLTIKQAARRFRVPPTTIYRWMHDGTIGAVTGGTEVARRRVVHLRYLIPEKEMTRMLHRRCEYCGRRFRPKHPRKTRFCCVNHQVYAWNKRQKALLAANKRSKARRSGP